jgi:hypothetical protein
MSEPRIGRLLVASLHQAIADVLPERLEFYENWINAPGLRDGTIGLAPLSAVLSFLRGEGERYNQITARAGEYAADWNIDGMGGVQRRLHLALPTPLRVRAALRTSRALVRSTYPGSRAVTKVRRGTATVDLRGSLFCEVREASVLPLCGFYTSAIARVLERYALKTHTRVDECRAAGGRRGCQMTFVIDRGTREQLEAA